MWVSSGRASQDAEAAKRICEALRATGVEVWLDQDGGLVGGDAWDAKIRGQIASCALFVPVVSANTQARLEGYFRLEWKLAAQRTHTMADEKTGFVQRRQGRWVESTANLRKAVQLDPTNLPIVVNLHYSLQLGRRYEELVALIERSNQRVPSQLDFTAPGTALGKRAEIAYIRFLATGSTREMEEVQASVTPAQLESPEGIDARKRWARLSGNFVEAIRLDRLQPYYGNSQRLNRRRVPPSRF